MRLAPAVAVAALLAAGCGPPEELDGDDSRVVTQARERLDDAIDTEEALRTSDEEALRLRNLVERAVATRDEVVLSEEVPSLIRGQRIDGRAASAFVAAAQSDPARALRAPAERQVDVPVDGLDDAGEDTRLPTAGNQKAGAFVSDTARDIEPIWPDLADRVRDAV